MILNQRAGKANRQGFTLIELLTVVAIIAVILSIAVGAFFRVRLSQEESATETTLSKIQNQLDAQVKAIFDNAKQEDVFSTTNPGMVLARNIAGGIDNRRTRVVWTKMQLRLELPTTFWEAMVWPSTVGLSPKSSYWRGLSGITPSDPTTMTEDQKLAESAALLYMIMSQGRRGVSAFNPTDVGPHAIGKINLYNRDFPIFIDSWGQPIPMIRWALNAAATDLNQPPHQILNKQNQPIDPQDPERTLLDAEWINNVTVVNQFILVVGYDPRTMQPPGFPLNLSPLVCSAGRDKTFGIDALLGRLNIAEDDNIYSYRLKGVGRSN